DRRGQIEKRSVQTDLGGTMRLGGQECLLKPQTLAQKIYGVDKIIERHRHRYEVNAAFIPQLEQAGLQVSGLSVDENLCEMIELPQSVHPWFVACQFHPEFTSTPRNGHPLFNDYIRAAINFSDQSDHTTHDNHDVPEGVPTHGRC